MGHLLAAGHPVPRVFRVVTTPRVALAIFCLVTAIWHLPVLYSAAEGTTLMHGIEHGFFLGSKDQIAGPMGATTASAEAAEPSGAVAAVPCAPRGHRPVGALILTTAGRLGDEAGASSASFGAGSTLDGGSPDVRDQQPSVDQRPPRRLRR